MNSSVNSVKSIVFHRDRTMSVALMDGRIITVPLKWYPRLANATTSQRKKWKIIGSGMGIHWPLVDEDLSIEGLLHGQPSPEYKPRKRSAARHTEARI